MSSVEGRDRGPAITVLAGGGDAPHTDAERVYGGALRFAGRPVPRVVANFVTSIDGVASVGLHDGKDTSTISGHDPADRYVMGMLRAAADVVLVGAGTLRASVGHQWTVEAVAPHQAGMLAGYRSSLERRSQRPTLAVVTGHGQLPSHVALTEPATDVVIVTTVAGAEHVVQAFPKLRVIAVGTQQQLDGAEVVSALHHELGAHLVLCEGGPTLMGTLLAAHSVHELFLTLAPNLAGRDASHPRLGLVNNLVAAPQSLRGTQLLSARRAGDHLLLRYQLLH